MSNIPVPPLSTDSPKEFADHVTENASAWLTYLRDINQLVSSQKEDIRTLRNNYHEAAAHLTDREAVIRY
ncbi:hypothetical protein CMUS01_09125 [Colletotrichum musicola]|uniref:Uncharacterized protein n=1 Tax=Colletotrichum musicola TaxID=2175873 RepID=A0A8H6K9D9_9PEZI|nr:hypothetical protein CMUS01_09125 [Colletotrichum musicola]